MKYQGFFVLYPTCILVKGRCNASINDLQRNTVYSIPLSLYNLFKKDNVLEIDNIYNILDSNEDKLFMDEYLDFLLENDLGVINFKKKFEPLSLQYSTNKIISNCIIDFDENSDHPLKYICEQLNKLRCEALQLRYYGEFPFSKIMSDISCFKDSTLRSIELLIVGTGSKEKDKKIILELIHTNPRISEVIFHSSSFDESEIYGDFLSITYTSQKILNESFCGCISKSYLLSQTQLYLESLYFNSCLYQKISIDRYGHIKNCPSMKKSFGLISESLDLQTLVNSEDFQSVWKIKKDDIEVCKECELRYACQDCRAYLVDPTNHLSKPLKCNYNPLK